jgi:DNA polymerase III alpha subunit (gram-positive type)
MHVISLDLEMCQPSGAICEIGVSIGHLPTRKILETKSFLVNPQEEISEFITALTGITNDMVKDAPDLVGAYRQMAEYIKPFGCHRQIIQWGSGDDWELKKQLGDRISFEDWIGGRTSMNVKNLVQCILTAKEQKTQGGLKKSCNKFNVPFSGPAHRAHKDSENTLRLYFSLLDLLKEIPFQGK